MVDLFSAQLDKRLEIVFVENGSSDNSRALLTELVGPNNPAYKLVTIDNNIGYGNGVYQGLLASSGDFIGWTHADLQCDPFDFFRAVQLFEALL